jgi:hypothetical protein
VTVPAVLAAKVFSKVHPLALSPLSSRIVKTSLLGNVRLTDSSFYENFRGLAI